DLLVGEAGRVAVRLGAVQVPHEVDVQRVVLHPAAAVHRLDFLGVTRVQVRLEVGLGVADAVDAGGLADAVADRLDPLLVTAVRVDLDGDLVAGDAAAVLDVLLGLVRVVGEDVAGDTRLVTRHALGREAARGLTGAVEDGLGDRLAVDR